jgi:hypothetical protein
MELLCGGRVYGLTSRSDTRCRFAPVRIAAPNKRFTDFFSICSNFLTKPLGHDDDVLSETLTFIPIESVSWAKGLKGRHCPDSEVEKIVALTLTMRRLALRLSARARARSPALPEEIARLIDPVIEKAKENFRMTSDALMQVFREGSTRVPVPSTRVARESFRNALQEVRKVQAARYPAHLQSSF